MTHKDPATLIIIMSLLLTTFSAPATTNVARNVLLIIGMELNKVFSSSSFNTVSPFKAFLIYSLSTIYCNLVMLVVSFHIDFYDPPFHVQYIFMRFPCFVVDFFFTSVRHSFTTTSYLCILVQLYHQFFCSPLSQSILRSDLLFFV